MNFTCLWPVDGHDIRAGVMYSPEGALPAGVLLVHEGPAHARLPALDVGLSTAAGCRPEAAAVAAATGPPDFLPPSLLLATGSQLPPDW